MAAMYIKWYASVVRQDRPKVVDSGALEKELKDLAIPQPQE
jgi:hypothetical protein